MVLKTRFVFRLTLTMLLISGLSGLAYSHGDVSPQDIDVSGIELLGEEWVEENPYVGNERAIEIGRSAYSQNCARCHGLGAVSGGVAPDLRALPADAEGDEWYAYRAREGSIRNGVTYMPRMGDYMSQESLWAIRAWLITLDNSDL